MTAGPETASVLVLGLGNVLCGDDGAGLFALEELRKRYAWSEDVALVDGGTLGLALLPTIESARSIIILDAILADALPGSVITLEGASVEPALRDRLPRTRSASPTCSTLCTGGVPGRGPFACSGSSRSAWSLGSASRPAWRRESIGWSRPRRPNSDR